MSAPSNALHYVDVLSFMCRRNPTGTGIDHWCVESSGNYTEDYDTGCKLAMEYLDFIGKRPTICHATLLNCIVRDIHENAGGRPFTGVEVGFFRQVNKFAMTAAVIRAESCLMKEEGGAS